MSERVYERVKVDPGLRAFVIAYRLTRRWGTPRREALDLAIVAARWGFQAEHVER